MILGKDNLPLEADSSIPNNLPLEVDPSTSLEETMEYARGFNYGYKLGYAAALQQVLIDICKECE